MERRHWIVLALWALAAAAPGAAMGQGAAGGPPSGPYVGLDVSIGQPSDSAAAGYYSADHGLEAGMRLGLGYRFGALRLEGQLGYESFTLNNLNPVAGSPISTGDSVGELSGMLALANAFVEFGEAGQTRPWLGIGAGFAQMKADYHEFNCSIFLLGCVDGPGIVSGADTVGAWQAMAGFAVPSPSGSSEWLFGYRYFGTEDIGLTVDGIGPARQEGIRSHSLLFGWRWNMAGG